MTYPEVPSPACVWIFNGPEGRFPGGVFTTVEAAEAWIARHRLTGVLTEYPLDIGSFEWAVSNHRTGLSAEKIRLKATDPSFIGSFSSAGQQHHHYAFGVREGQGET